MKIALAQEGENSASLVAATFAAADFLLIYDVENGRVIEALDGRGLPDKEMAFARKTVDADCEALLTGPIAEAPFLVIADEGCVTRYDGRGKTGDDAIAAMKADKLPLIRDHIGGKGCSGEHKATV